MFPLSDLSPTVPPLGDISESRLFRRRVDSRDNLNDYEFLQNDNNSRKNQKSFIWLGIIVK